VQLCDTHKEYIPEVTEHPHDYNMSTENEILDSKINASANINDPHLPRRSTRGGCPQWEVPRPSRHTSTGGAADGVHKYRLGDSGGTGVEWCPDASS
jgi:hypothetical protein